MTGRSESQEAHGLLPYREMLEATPLLRGLTAAQLAGLAAVAEERRYAAGEPILTEGTSDRFVHVLVEGRAQLVKASSLAADPLRMHELHAGDVLGELKLVDPHQPSSASVVAVTPVTAVAIDLAGFLANDALAAAQATVLRNVGQILAERLRQTSTRAADAMYRELEETRARAYAGRFLVSMFAMLASYGLALTALPLLPPEKRPPDSILSFVFVLWTAVPVILSARRSPFTPESYGLTLRGSLRKSIEALGWSLPVLVLLALAKLAMMAWVPSMANRPFIDPDALFAGRPFDWGFYLVALLIYLVHTPLQELVARSGLQGTIVHLIPSTPGRTNWRAIVTSSLLFSAAHCYIGFWFALAAFLPGLFWGWLFDRQRSFVAVTVSHLVIGFWALFVLGIHAVVGGG